MTDTNPAAAAPPIDLASSTPGEYLRRLREEKGHTHAAVSSALHLTVHYIKALESDEYGKLPGLTFVKGYLRSYARFLGADVENVLARFDEHITGLLDAGQHTARVERSKRRQDQALRWAIGAGLVVVAGIAAGWWFMRDAQSASDATPRASSVGQQLAMDVITNQPPATAATPPAAFTPPAQATATFGGADQNAFAAGDANGFGRDAGLAQDSFTADAEQDDFGGNAFTAEAVSEQDPFAAAATERDQDQVATLATDAALPEASTAAAGQGDAAATDTPQAAPEAAAAPATAGVRQISLIGTGDDELRLRLKGSSWIEVSDGNSARLFSDTLANGDSLTIRGQGPFRVVLGDAMNVDVALNAKPVDISADIRADRTARVVLGAPATAATTSSSVPATGTEVSQ